VADLSFVSGIGYNHDFTLEYYIWNSREMPDPDRIKVLKRERWHVTEEGRIVLK